MIMATDIEVYESGELSVIGVGVNGILFHWQLDDCHEIVLGLIHEHGCKYLAIDLTRACVIPSGFLGLLVSIHRMGVEVMLFNPSDDLREVLRITRLERLFQLETVDLESEKENVLINRVSTPLH